MAWTPVANYFALVTAPGSLPAGTVLLGRDDFREIRDDRDTWIRLTGGGAFTIVWGLDGRPVTRGEAAQLLTGRTATHYSDTEVDAAGVKREVQVALLQPRVMPPLHPRQIRPEAVGGTILPRQAYEPLASDNHGCKACAARTRNNLVAEISHVAQGVDHAPQKLPDPTRTRSPHTPAAPPPAVHARPGAVLSEAGEGRSDAKSSLS